MTENSLISFYGGYNDFMLNYRYMNNLVSTPRTTLGII